MAIVVTTLSQNNNASGATVVLAIPGGGVPSGATIVVAAGESAGTSVSSLGTAADGTNTYNKKTSARRNAVGNNFGGIFVAENVAALTSSNSITYTKNVSGSIGAISALYATGVATASYDAGVTASATGSSKTPSVTSGTLAVSGELIIGMVFNQGSGFSGTFTQDSTNGSYATPFDEAPSSARIDGGNFVSSGTTAKTYAPSFSLSAAWAAFIIGLQPSSLSLTSDWGFVVSPDAIEQGSPIALVEHVAAEAGNCLVNTQHRAIEQSNSIIYAEHRAAEQGPLIPYTEHRAAEQDNGLVYVEHRAGDQNSWSISAEHRAGEAGSPPLPDAHYGVVLDNQVTPVQHSANEVADRLVYAEHRAGSGFSLTDPLAYYSVARGQLVAPVEELARVKHDDVDPVAPRGLLNGVLTSFLTEHLGLLNATRPFVMEQHATVEGSLAEPVAYFVIARQSEGFVVAHLAGVAGDEKMLVEYAGTLASVIADETMLLSRSGNMVRDTLFNLSRSGELVASTTFNAEIRLVAFSGASLPVSTLGALAYDEEDAFSFIADLTRDTILWTEHRAAERGDETGQISSRAVMFADSVVFISSMASEEADTTLYAENRIGLIGEVNLPVEILVKASQADTVGLISLKASLVASRLDPVAHLARGQYTNYTPTVFLVGVQGDRVSATEHRAGERIDEVIPVAHLIKLALVASEPISVYFSVRETISYPFRAAHAASLVAPWRLAVAAFARVLQDEPTQVATNSRTAGSESLPMDRQGVLVGSARVRLSRMGELQEDYPFPVMHFLGIQVQSETSFCFSFDGVVAGDEPMNGSSLFQSAGELVAEASYLVRSAGYAVLPFEVGLSSYTPQAGQMYSILSDGIDTIVGL